MLRSCLVTAGLALLPTLAPSLAMAQERGPRAKSDSETVVFVCEHGTVKSVVAMAWFRKLARERHLPMRALSRGTAPDSAVPAKLRDAMRRDGLALGVFTPTRFGSADIDAASMVIAFDQPTVGYLVGARAPSAAWNGLPAVSDGYRTASDSIRGRVKGLVDSLYRAWRRDSLDRAQRKRVPVRL